MFPAYTRIGTATECEATQTKVQLDDVAAPTPIAPTVCSTPDVSPFVHRARHTWRPGPACLGTTGASCSWPGASWGLPGGNQQGEGSLPGQFPQVWEKDCGSGQPLVPSSSNLCRKVMFQGSRWTIPQGCAWVFLLLFRYWGAWSGTFLPPEWHKAFCQDCNCTLEAFKPWIVLVMHLGTWSPLPLPNHLSPSTTAWEAWVTQTLFQSPLHRQANKHCLVYSGLLHPVLAASQLSAKVGFAGQYLLRSPRHYLTPVCPGSYFTVPSVSCSHYPHPEVLKQTSNYKNMGFLASLLHASSLSEKEKGAT